MTPKEAIEIIKVAIAEVEWNYPMDYAIAFETAIKALEKQIPKKPIALTNRYPDEQYECPVCGNLVGYPTFRNTPFGEMRNGEIKYDYCLKCGQKLKWGEEDKQTG